MGAGAGIAPTTPGNEPGKLLLFYPASKSLYVESNHVSPAYEADAHPVSYSVK